MYMFQSSKPNVCMCTLHGHFLFCKHKVASVPCPTFRYPASTVTCSHFTVNELHLYFLPELIKSVDNEVFIVAHDGARELCVKWGSTSTRCHIYVHTHIKCEFKHNGDMEMIFRGVPFLIISWPEVLVVLNCFLLQKGRATSQLSLVLVWGAQLSVGVAMSMQ